MKVFAGFTFEQPLRTLDFFSSMAEAKEHKRNLLLERTGTPVIVEIECGGGKRSILANAVSKIMNDVRMMEFAMTGVYPADMKTPEPSVTAVHVTPTTLQRFKKYYKQAVDEDSDSFEFEDVQIHTKYAKYLIEYLEARIKK